jgi:drug/metabolite transporter (DMT)-like permease
MHTQSILLAYIDPNTGGLLMQYLLPVFVAIGAGWIFLKDRVSEAIARISRRFRRA